MKCGEAGRGGLGICAISASCQTGFMSNHAFHGEPCMVCNAHARHCIRTAPRAPAPTSVQAACGCGFIQRRVRSDAHGCPRAESLWMRNNIYWATVPGDGGWGRGVRYDAHERLPGLSRGAARRSGSPLPHLCREPATLHSYKEPVAVARVPGPSRRSATRDGRRQGREE